MPERKRLPVPGETAIAAALHTEACVTADLAFGSGQRYDLAGGHAVWEVFPERHMSRITTPTSRLELFDSPAPQVIDGQVVISRERGHEDTTLSVSPEGTVVFSYVSTAPAPLSGAPATPDETSPVPGASDDDVAPEQPATAPQRPQEPPAVAPASTGLADPGRAAQPRTVWCRAQPVSYRTQP